MRALALIPVMASLFVAACGVGQPESQGATLSASGLRLVSVGSFDQPLYLASPPGDRRRQMVVEQPGRIVRSHSRRC